MSKIIAKVMAWCKNTIVALDQTCNALAAGWPDETLSSRAWRWEMKGQSAWPRKCIDILFFWEKNHCKQSWHSELTRAQMPPALRGEALAYEEDEKDMTPAIFFIHGLGGLPTTEAGARLDAATGIVSKKLAYDAGANWATNWATLLGQTKSTANKNCIFVGESMGGFFAAQLAVQYSARCYLLNPAIAPQWQLRQFIGPFTIEGGREVIITEELVRSYNAAPDPRTLLTKGRIGLMLSYNDDLIDPRYTEAFYAGYSAFADWVDDGHGIGLDSSFDMIRDRVDAWDVDSAFARIREAG